MTNQMRDQIAVVLWDGQRTSPNRLFLGIDLPGDVLLDPRYWEYLLTREEPRISKRSLHTPRES